MQVSPDNEAPYRLIDDVSFGTGVVVQSFVNLYGCQIGDHSRIGTYVEVQRGASIGASCKIQSHTFICEGVSIEDDVFVGHGVVFVNDKYPRATASDGQLQTDADWQLLETRVGRGASLGSGSVILGGIQIGEEAIVGAGAVVSERCARRCPGGRYSGAGGVASRRIGWANRYSAPENRCAIGGALEAGLADPQGTNQDELTRAVEAADRAGSIVSEHVRSIIDAAQKRAADIDRTAQQEAESIRTEAYEAAQRVLDRIDSLEGQLGTLVNGLRDEAGNLSGNVDRRS